MSLKITGHPKTEAKTEVEQKRKLDWYVPIFYIQSLKLFREASRINFLIISHPHSSESRFSSLQNEHDKWLVHTGYYTKIISPCSSSRRSQKCLTRFPNHRKKLKKH